MYMTEEQFNEAVELNNYYIETFMSDIEEMEDDLSEHWCPRYAEVRDLLVEAVEDLQERADDLSYVEIMPHVDPPIHPARLTPDQIYALKTRGMKRDPDPLPTRDINSPPPATASADRKPTFYQAGMPMDSVYADRLNSSNRFDKIIRKSIEDAQETLNDNLKSAKEKQQKANDLRKMAKEMDLDKMHRYNHQQMNKAARKSWADAAAQWMSNYGRF